MNIGVIGYKNHAKRIIDGINGCGINCSLEIYHPTKVDGVITTNNFDDIVRCDSVFICSPNDTHLFYVKELIKQNEFSGKIFCEKPPVNTKKDLKEMRKICLDNSGRVYFNFNFRKSRVSNILSNDLKKLGRPIQVSVSITHGLAFKDGYKESWRSQRETHPLGVLETVSVHWIDLFISLFGKVKEFKVLNSISSKNGTAYDTSSLFILHTSGVVTNIFASYASCKNFFLTYQGTNGVAFLNSNGVKLHYPRDSFDQSGNFVFPGVKETIEYSEKDDYTNSLNNSIRYFWNVQLAKENWKIKRS